MIKSVDNHIAKLEQFFNPIDCIPFFGSYTGMIRILAGSVQIIAGVIFGLFKAIFSSNRRYLEAFKQGYIYSLHGAANVLRGSIAMLPGINLILFIHDKYLGRMNYPEETLREKVYPLSTGYKLAHYY